MPPEDNLTRAGAYRLANRIRQFWKSRGHAAEMIVEPVPGGADSPAYQVRSNIGPLGYPPLAIA